MNDVVINIYLLNKLLGTLETLFDPDNPFRQEIEQRIHNMLDDLGADKPE